MLYCICGLCCRKIRHFHCRKTDNNENMSRPAWRAVLSKAFLTGGEALGVRRMGRTVCKTVPCYILSLIRGTAITSPLVKIRQGVVIIYRCPGCMSVSDILRCACSPRCRCCLCCRKKYVQLLTETVVVLRCRNLRHPHCHLQS